MDWSILARFRINWKGEPSHFMSTNAVQFLILSAKERDWNKSREITKDLLSGLTKDRVLRITLNQMYLPLATFEMYHPSVDWAKMSLEAVRNQKVTKELIDNHWERAISEFSTPGSANFLAAIDSLLVAIEQENIKAIFTERCVDAIASALMSNLVGYWYGLNIDDWYKWNEAREHIDPETGEYEDQDPAITLIPIRFWSDNEVIKRDVEGWIQLAEDIKRELENQGSAEI